MGHCSDGPLPSSLGPGAFRLRLSSPRSGDIPCRPRPRPRPPPPPPPRPRSAPLRPPEMDTGRWRRARSPPYRTKLRTAPGIRRRMLVRMGGPGRDRSADGWLNTPVRMLTCTHKVYEGTARHIQIKYRSTHMSTYNLEFVHIIFCFKNGEAYKFMVCRLFHGLNFSMLLHMQNVHAAIVAHGKFAPPSLFCSCRVHLREIFTGFFSLLRRYSYLIVWHLRSLDVSICSPFAFACVCQSPLTLQTRFFAHPPAFFMLGYAHNNSLSDGAKWFTYKQITFIVIDNHREQILCAYALLTRYLLPKQRPEHFRQFFA